MAVRTNAGGARGWGAMMGVGGMLVALGAAPAVASNDPSLQLAEENQGSSGESQGTPSAPSTGSAPNGGDGGAADYSPGVIDLSVLPAPPVNENLPPEIDAKAPFAQQISCDPQTRPGVLAFAMLISGHYSRPAFSGARPCIDYASFHHDGRALDWPLNVGVAADELVADSVIVWLTSNSGEMAKRLGIEYLIWNGRIWHNDNRGWQYYSGNPHTDHIHFSFTWDGARMRTSWWTGVAVTQPDLGPCDATPGQYAAIPLAPRLTACDPAAVTGAPASDWGQVRPGESGGGVSALQQVLGVEQTGTLDEATRAALLEWQLDRGLPMTGVADNFTYAEAQGIEIGELPAEVLAVPLQEWQRTAFTPYLRTTLTQGDKGAAAKVLQEAVGADVDGDFGPKTAKALAGFEETIPVLAIQAARRGGGPAQVTPLTWTFLERAAHPTIAIREVKLSRGDVDRNAGQAPAESAPQGSQVASQAGAAGAGEGLSGPAEGAPSSSAGGAVSVLQTLLGLEVDGSFGPLTEEAVRELQEEAGLEVTGVVDGPTWTAAEEVALAEDRIEGAPGQLVRATDPEKKTRKDKPGGKKARNDQGNAGAKPAQPPRSIGLDLGAEFSVPESSGEPVNPLPIER